MDFQAAPNGDPPARYAFDDFVLDAGERVLLRGGEPVPLTPKAFDTLLALVRASGRLLSKDELLATVWPATFIEEATLAQNVFTVRRALGTRPDGGPFIETVPRHGYRFAVEVRVVPDEAAPVASPVVTTAMPAAATVASPAPARPPLPTGALEPSRRWQFLTAALLVLGGAAVILTIGARRRPEPPAPVPFQLQRIERLTADGTARHAAVSASGAYVAFVRSERDGRQGIWLRQAAASALVPVLLPVDGEIGGLAFAPRDQSILYVLYLREQRIASLFEVPVLGGTPRRLLVDVDSAPAFSPDGRHIAFVRNDPVQRTSALVVADRNGGSERVLARRSGRQSFATAGLAWSPDDTTIACAARDVDAGGRFMTVVGVSVHDGRERPLTTHRWAEVGQVAWPPGSDAGAGALVVDAWDTGAAALAKALWEVRVPGGAVRRLTHDLGDYAGVSSTADGRALVSVQRTQPSALWVAPLAQPQRAVRITDGAGDPHADSLGVSWTADGRLLYGSVASGNVDVWLMNADGSERRQLTADPAPDYKPSPAPDGRVVFASWRGGRSRIWDLDLDLDSGEQRLLTRGRVDTYPQVSRDGRFLVYVSVGTDGQPLLWRADREGGGAVPLDPRAASLPALSPAGDEVAAFLRERGDGPLQLAVLPLDAAHAGAGAARLFDLPPTTFMQAGLQWTPDGRAVVYVDTRGEVSNLVRQPLDGGPPEPLTSFAESRIFRFAISPRGDLVCARGSEIDDVVMLTAAGGSGRDGGPGVAAF